jgi:hypothetical protein
MVQASLTISKPDVNVRFSNGYGSHLVFSIKKPEPIELFPARLDHCKQNKNIL